MMRDEWRGVFWMGGSPCSGKSSIAKLLAAQFDLTIYAGDDHFDRHLKQSSPQGQPNLHQIGQMDCEQIWMRPVSAQIAGEIAAYREEFAMILADLANLPGDKPILVEGAALLPDLVAQWLPRPQQAIFVVPTERFQRTTYAQRGWIHGVLADCSQPEQAFANWMDRDVGFGAWVRETAVSHNLRVLTVNGGRPLAINAALVAAHFGYG